MAISTAPDLSPGSEQEMDDTALWQGLARQDITALEALYDRYGGLAYGFAYRIVQDQQSAEDVVQESFHQVWRYAASYQPSRGSLRSWLLGVVHHRAIDVVRRRSVRPQTVSLASSTFDLPGTTDTWSEVGRRLTRDTLRRAMLHLSPEQREAIELAFFQGYTHVQIADQLGVPLGTVKGRIRLGLHHLRSLLTDEGAVSLTAAAI
jgi:RNA polymerase sigma factor (sigma-70 family)